MINKFSGFNSWKGLMYAPWYKRIAEEKPLLPPVMAVVDPVQLGFSMDGNHLLDVINVLGEWGVKSIYFGGGYEPTSHPMITNALELSYLCGLCVAIETDGLNVDEHLACSILEHCSVVNVNVDAATRPTYTKIKGVDLLPRVLANIETIVKMSRRRIQKGHWDLSYRFQISYYNQEEIYSACKMAKDLGCTSFYASSIDYRREGVDMALGAFNYTLVMDKLAHCQDLVDEGFDVFGEAYQFNSNEKPEHNFKQCWAAPLTIQICADGNCYFCPEQRLNPDYIIGRHYPKPNNIRRLWGKKLHMDILMGDTPYFCTNRCSFAPYHEQCEKLFADGNDETDPMRWRFPC